MKPVELRGILQIGERPKRRAVARIKTAWFRWRTRHVFDWRPLSEADIKRTAELAKRFGWQSK